VKIRVAFLDDSGHAAVHVRPSLLARVLGRVEYDDVACRVALANGTVAWVWDSSGCYIIDPRIVEAIERAWVLA